VRLSHGKADLHLSQNAILDENDSNVAVHQWLSGRKKGMLSDFAVGTIDHVLMAGLRQKHLVLRHLGLANKVVIIDEVHAYDVYMENYLLKALNWLGAYGVSVIVLSATLPASRRKTIVDAYNNKKTDISECWAKSLAYPLVTYTSGGETKSIETLPSARQTQVDINFMQEDRIIDILEEGLADGGYAGIIVNTVKQAQEIYTKMSQHFGGDVVKLLHAGFIASDRIAKETELVKILGGSNKNKRQDKLIIIGTQIFEQSMDLDFDILLTSLCPIDLLLQRIGRLHRHQRLRPNALKIPTCHIMHSDWGGFDAGSQAVYGQYLLMRTRAVLPPTISLPQEIPALVSAVYEEDTYVTIPEGMATEYARSRQEWGDLTIKSVIRSKSFQISSPNLKRSLLDWLDTSIADDPTEKRAEAAVRDTGDSIEVIVVQKRQNKLYLLDWLDDDQPIPHHAPHEELAQKIAACSIRLPAYFGREWIIDRAIKELEQCMKAENIVIGWYQSSWLNGCLCLILDENGQTTLCDHQLQYDRHLGLSYTKI